MPEVSVIVPVFNTADYLYRCIDSLLNQTFKDFELLLLDDGSTDDSYSICLKYAQKDSRVKAYRYKHCGVAAIRNEGLKAALGKYLMFCDSDDYVENNWIEALYDTAVVNRDNLVFCGYKKVDSSQTLIKKYQIEGVFHNTSYELADFYKLMMCGLMFSLCDKIFSRDIIINNKLAFDTHAEEGEDLIFVAEYLKCCKGFVYVPVCTYNYAYNGVPTITRKFQPHHYDSLKRMYLARLSVISQKDRGHLSDYYLNRFLVSLKEVNDNRNTESKRQKLKYSNYILRDKAFRIAVKNSTDYGCNWKLRLLLFIRSYRLFCFFNRIIMLKNKD